VRGRDVDDALAMLRFSKKRASDMVRQGYPLGAVANANEQETAPIRNTLFVAKAWADPGPTIKPLPAEGSRQGVSNHEAHESSRG
jgi:ribosomal protein L22